MSDESIIIRPATPGDALALRDIYAPYVTDTPVTFECNVPTVEDFSQRIGTILNTYPYLVAVRNGEPVGYAYASALRTRSAYIWSVETSIYVRSDARHMGTGVTLYRNLEQILSAQNIRSVFACITAPNKDSYYFHLAMGFNEVGRFYKCAYKLGQWRDVVWMEKSLTSSDAPPKPFIPFPQLDPDPLLQPPLL